MGHLASHLQIESFRSYADQRSCHGAILRSISMYVCLCDSWHTERRRSSDRTTRVAVFQFLRLEGSVSAFSCWYFYTGDLKKEPGWRLCSWQAQNLWLRIL